MEINYFMPTRILMGKGAVIENYELFKYHGSRAFIVTGKKSSKKNGSLKDVEEALKLSGIAFKIFDEVEENPSLDTVEKASIIGKEFGADFIIGIGGGSPIDASKAIAVMIKNPNINKDNILEAKKLESIDVIAVPTTSGTGTEVTQYSIVTDHENQRKINLGQNVFPKIAFLDPRYTEYMSVETTISTAVDAFTHIVEGYLNLRANIFTDELVKMALNIWGQCIDGLILKNINYDQREKLMLASTLGGIIIAQTGTSLPHGMGYPLTYFKDIPHGLANGCLYIEYLKMFKNRDRVNNIYKMLGLNSYEKLEDILDILTKIEVDIMKEDIEEYTKGMISNKAKLKNHPEEVDYDGIYKVYEKSLLK